MKKVRIVRGRDKRKRNRIEFSTDIPANFRATGINLPVKITDMSYEGLGLVIPAGESGPLLVSQETRIELPNQVFKAKIANQVLLDNQDLKLGLILPEEIHKAIDFNTVDSSWDKVTDPETIQNIYQDLVFKGPEAPIQVNQFFSSSSVIPIKIKDSETLICEIAEVHRGSIVNGKVRCVFHLFQTCHAFDSYIIRKDEPFVELQLSDTLARLLRRETIRVEKKKADFDVTIRLRNNDLQTTIEEYEVFDYSEHGISILDPSGELALPRSLIFEDVVIEVKDKYTILGKAEVRSYQWNRKEEAYVVGLQFTPNQDPHLTNWHNLILKARYPALDFKYQTDDHDKIWDLFEKSGYLNHLDKNQNENLKLRRKESETTWEKLEKSGVVNSRRIMLRKNVEISGHLQLDQYYKNSWCVHHLAISKEASKIIAKDIYAAMTDFLSSRQTKYIITYHRPDLSWNQKNYHDFVKSYQYKDHNFMELFALYDFKFNNRAFDKKNNQVRVANEFDLKSIYNFYHSKYPFFVLEALNLSPDFMKLESIEEEFHNVRLVRGREFFVFSEERKIKAFLQVEWGTDATNIFSLFDSIFVYIIEEISKEKIIDLIKAAGDLLLTKGKTNALVLIKDEYSVDIVDENIKYLCNENRWIAKSETLKRYQAYAQILFGHLMIRKERNKNKINK